MTFPLKRIHFIGIGGIGMSAIAEMLPALNIQAQGSNDKENANTKRLREKGFRLFIGHRAENLQGCDAVVVSSAIHPDNVEFVAAKKLNLPIAHRSEMLAELLKYKRSICVAGTHGKTTTSSLIAHLLMTDGKDPSFIIGGILNSQKSNAGVGQGAWVVAEADESDGSFLKLPTTVSVVTNIEPEHLDYYKTFDREKMAFQTYLNQTAFYGACVVCLDHPVVREILPEIKGRKVITYGLTALADVHAENVRVKGMKTVFDVLVRQGNQIHSIPQVEISLMGQHNILNSLAAIATALFVGVSEKSIYQGLASFMGIQRRLTLRGIEAGVAVYDDYGHHPTEIRATLQALKSHITGRLIVVFQPHRYSRFQNLWADFLTCFEGVQALFVSDVYAAGDAPIAEVSAEKFVEALKGLQKNVFKTSEETFAREVSQFVQSGDTVVCFNAGSLSGKIPLLLEALKQK